MPERYPLPEGAELFNHDQEANVRRRPHIFIPDSSLPAKPNIAKQLSNFLQPYAPFTIFFNLEGWYIVFDGTGSGLNHLDLCYQNLNMKKLLITYELHMSRFPEGISQVGPSRGRLSMTLNAEGAMHRQAGASVARARLGSPTAAASTRFQHFPPKIARLAAVSSYPSAPAHRVRDGAEPPVVIDLTGSDEDTGVDLHTAKTPICHICKSAAPSQAESLIMCSTCPRQYHYRCHVQEPRPANFGENSLWRCCGCTKRLVPLDRSSDPSNVEKISGSSERQRPSSILEPFEPVPNPQESVIFRSPPAAAGGERQQSEEINAEVEIPESPTSACNDLGTDPFNSRHDQHSSTPAASSAGADAQAPSTDSASLSPFDHVVRTEIDLQSSPGREDLKSGRGRQVQCETCNRMVIRQQEAITDLCSQCASKGPQVILDSTETYRSSTTGDRSSPSSSDEAQRLSRADLFFSQASDHSPRTIPPNAKLRRACEGCHLQHVKCVPASSTIGKAGTLRDVCITCWKRNIPCISREYRTPASANPDGTASDACEDCWTQGTECTHNTTANMRRPSGEVHTNEDADQDRSMKSSYGEDTRAETEPPDQDQDHPMEGDTNIRSHVLNDDTTVDDFSLPNPEPTSKFDSKIQAKFRHLPTIDTALDVQTSSPLSNLDDSALPSSAGSRFSKLSADKSFDLGTPDKRPKGALLRLIGMALLDSPGQRLSCKKTVEWIAKNVPGYEIGCGTWEKSVSASLSAHRAKKSSDSFLWSKDAAQEATGPASASYVLNHELPGSLTSHWDQCLQHLRQVNDTDQSSLSARMTVSPTMKPQYIYSNSTPSQTVNSGEATREQSADKSESRTNRSESVTQWRIGDKVANGIFVSGFARKRTASDSESGAGQLVAEKVVKMPTVGKDADLDVEVMEIDGRGSEPFQDVSLAEPRQGTNGDLTAVMGSSAPQPIEASAGDEIMCTGSNLNARLTRSLAQESTERDYSAKSLTDEWGSAHLPWSKAWLAAKQEEIKNRPTRKQRFGKLIAAPWVSNTKIPTPVNILNQSFSAKTRLPTSQPRQTWDELSSEGWTSYPSPQEFMGVPDNPVPIIHNQQLAYREEEVRSDSGMRPRRAKAIYRVRNS